MFKCITDYCVQLVSLCERTECQFDYVLKWGNGPEVGVYIIIQHIICTSNDKWQVQMMQIILQTMKIYCLWESRNGTTATFSIVICLLHDFRTLWCKLCLIWIAENIFRQSIDRLFCRCRRCRRSADFLRFGIEKKLTGRHAWQWKHILSFWVQSTTKFGCMKLFGMTTYDRYHNLAVVRRAKQYPLHNTAKRCVKLPYEQQLSAQMTPIQWIWTEKISSMSVCPKLEFFFRGTQRYLALWIFFLFIFFFVSSSLLASSYSRCHCQFIRHLASQLFVMENVMNK